MRVARRSLDARATSTSTRRASPRGRDDRARRRRRRTTTTTTTTRGRIMAAATAGDDAAGARPAGRARDGDDGDEIARGTRTNKDRDRYVVHELGGYKIEGVSVGGRETSVVLPALGVAFDSGAMPAAVRVRGRDVLESYAHGSRRWVRDVHRDARVVELGAADGAAAERAERGVRDVYRIAAGVGRQRVESSRDRDRPGGAVRDE